MKRIFLIHRWVGTPQSDWYQWAKAELEKKGYAVEIPAMPNTEEPVIEEWVAKLQELVPAPDQDTFFIGHSIGCQTILRYFETLLENVEVGKVVLVAPWTRLKPIIKEEEGAEAIAKPWLETSIDWEKAQETAESYTALFSTDDYYVYPEEATLFAEKLKAKTLTLENKGHFTEDEGVTELPELLQCF